MNEHWASIWLTEEIHKPAQIKQDSLSDICAILSSRSKFMASWIWLVSAELSLMSQPHFLPGMWPILPNRHFLTNEQSVLHHSSKVLHRSPKQNTVLGSYLSRVSLLLGPKPPMVEGHKSRMSKANVIALKSRHPTQFCGHHVLVGCIIQIWLALVSLDHWDGLGRAGYQYSPSRAQGTHNSASHHWLVQIPADPRDKNWPC